MQPPEEDSFPLEFLRILNQQRKAAEDHWPFISGNIKSDDIGKKAAGLAIILCVTDALLQEREEDYTNNAYLRDQGIFAIIFSLLELSTLDWINDNNDPPGDGAIRPHRDVGHDKWTLVLKYLDAYFTAICCEYHAGNPNGRCYCAGFLYDTPFDLSGFHHDYERIIFREIVSRSELTEESTLQPLLGDYREFDWRAPQFLRDFYNELLVKKNIIEVFRSWLMHVVDVYNEGDTPIGFHFKALAYMLSPAFTEGI